MSKKLNIVKFSSWLPRLLSFGSLSIQQSLACTSSTDYLILRTKKYSLQALMMTLKIHILEMLQKLLFCIDLRVKSLMKLLSLSNLNTSTLVLQKSITKVISFAQ